MKKIFAVCLFMFPFFTQANANVSVSPDTQSQTILLQKIHIELAAINDKLGTKTPNKNICLNESKSYSEGAIITLNGSNYRCENNNVLLTEKKEYDMRWQRISDSK